MKLYIHVGKQPINGYQNIDLATSNIDFNNLDPICEPAECNEIVLDDLLSFINIQQTPRILECIITRLRKGGKLIISNWDSNELMKSYQNGMISIADLNYALFGNDSYKRSGCISYIDIQPILINNGLNILSINLNNGKFMLKAQRG